MLFTVVDLILIVFVLIFVITGFMMGLIEAVGALAGVFVGAFLAGHLYRPVATFFTPIFLGHSVAATIVSFLIIFTIANRLVVFVFYLLNKIFNFIAIIPFLGSINKLAGAILGLVEGILVAGLLLYVVSRFAGIIPWVSSNLASSQVAHVLVQVSGVVIAMLPKALTSMVSIF